MASFSINGVVQAEYEYNAQGQQVVRRLTQSQQTIHNVFDLDGNRIAEYLYDEVTGTSTLIREYIWLNGQVIGVWEGGQLFYVRSDQIHCPAGHCSQCPRGGRPVFATNNLGFKVWEASYLPFGGVEASSGPNSDLRFPGQWFQSESGLHQNWMRDYDPTTGRYLQADPLGLVDGASVYGYALQNPLYWIDFDGREATKYFVKNADGSWRCVSKAQYQRALRNGKETRISGPSSAGKARQSARQIFGDKRAQHGAHGPKQFPHFQHKNGGGQHIFYGNRGQTLMFGGGAALGAFGLSYSIGKLIMEPEPDPIEMCLADPNYT